MIYFNKIIVLFIIIIINVSVYFIYNQYKLTADQLLHKSFLEKMFIHSDLNHLTSNMISLTVISVPILNLTGITLLSNQFYFGFFYVASGYVSSFGKNLLFNFLIKSNEINKDKYTNRYNCDYFFCGIINKPLLFLRGGIYDIQNFTNYMALNLFGKSEDIGSSGSIYAISGSSIALSFYSRDKYRYISIFFIIYELSIEIFRIPKNLHVLKDYQFQNEKIGHHVHVTGFFFGLLIGFLTLYNLKRKILKILLLAIILSASILISVYFYLFLDIN